MAENNYQPNGKTSFCKKGVDMMRDLKKLEGKFHEFLKSCPMEEYYDFT